jgi:hypothetical protein
MIRLALISLVCFTSTTLAQGELTPRKLAPGVITIVPPQRDESDTFSGPRAFVEIVDGIEGLKWQPNFAPQSETLVALARQSISRRMVWCLEFSFKPLRMTYVDLPQPNGQIASELVWYMVYNVRNTGYHLNPVQKPDQWGNELVELERANSTVRFFPQLTLECFDLKKAYVDRVLPLAVEKIRLIEKPGATLYNSVEISALDIPVSTEEDDQSVWGVATWVGVDPRTDFFAVFVQRLTNAYRWQDLEGQFKPGDAPGTGRVYEFKTLQLNFWRPGDSLREHQNEIRFGMPAFEDVQGRLIEDETDLLKLYRVPQPVDHQWVYRP